MIQKMSFNPYAAQSKNIAVQKNVAFGSSSLDVASEISIIMINLAKNSSKHSLSYQSPKAIPAILAEAHEDIAKVLRNNPNMSSNEIADILNHLAKTFRAK